MAEPALIFGCALLAFGPFLSLFFLIVYHKAQLVIVVTTAAFFFLLGSLGASVFWKVFDVVGLGGPLAAILPGVFLQFISRCMFISLYHKVERVIEVTLHRQREEELASRRNPSDASHRATRRQQEGGDWEESARLRLELNDASCGVAAGVGFGGMHATMVYGTLLASQMTNNVGILYQDSCPAIPSLVVSGLYAFCFSILDIFWMLLSFYGMRRRSMYHRGQHDTGFHAIGGWFGNSRTGGNVALLFALVSHFLTSLFTTADFFKGGCYFSLPAVGGMVLVTAYLFWAGVGRIYMPPSRPLTMTNNMSRADSD